MRNLKNWKYKQWDKPIRFLKNGYGLILWKWCGLSVPCTTIAFNKFGFISYNIFHNGSGFTIHLPSIIIINLCVDGKIGWWYKHGFLRIRISNKEWKF